MNPLDKTRRNVSTFEVYEVTLGSQNTTHRSSIEAFYKFSLSHSYRPIEATLLSGLNCIVQIRRLDTHPGSDGTPQI